MEDFDKQEIIFRNGFEAGVNMCAKCIVAEMQGFMPEDVLIEKVQNCVEKLLKITKNKNE